MKKMILMAAVLGMVVSLADKAGAVNQPTVSVAYDQRGGAVDPFYANVKYKRIAEPYETLVTSNSALLVGVIPSSVAPTTQDYLTFRDTNCANGSGTVVIGKLMFLSTSAAIDIMSRIPHPIQFGKGITVGANGGAAFANLGSEYTVLYLENR